MPRTLDGSFLAKATKTAMLTANTSRSSQSASSDGSVDTSLLNACGATNNANSFRR